MGAPHRRSSEARSLTHMTAPADNLIEARRRAVQAELDARRSAAERNRLGQFATPYLLAVEIARQLQLAAGESLPVVRFADPAVGTGSFYSALLAVFGPGRIERAIGIE